VCLVQPLISDVAAIAVNLLFPSLCRLCGGRLLHAGRTPVCGSCLAAIAVPPASACPRCGEIPAAPGVAGVCLKCQASSPPYSAALSAADYTGVARSLILLLKFRGVMPVANLWAARLAALAPRLPARPDLVVPVPLAPRRRRQRGGNQSAAIGRRLARRLGCVYAERALRRVRETAPQSGLTAPERERNVAGAFAAPTQAVRGKCVLLVDDVLTTGATARAASAALLSAGARQVMVMTATRARRDLPPEAA
jgi:ComF family protein